jgi:signal transduction histidine kinase
VCKLLRAQEEKERAIRSLLLSISHELREPAQSGLAASQLLSQRRSVRADAEATFLVDAIGASCGLLLGLVSNVLSMRSIESGALEMTVTAFDPGAAVRALLQVCRLGCTTARVALRAAPLPRTVTADKTFLCSILQNLGAHDCLLCLHQARVLTQKCVRSAFHLLPVTNAIKFEAGGGVTVSLSCVAGVDARPTADTAAAASPTPLPPMTPLAQSRCGGSSDSELTASNSAHEGAAFSTPAPTHTLIASVSDRGRGLSSAQAARVFDAYEAADSSAGGGTGLGLFSARPLMTSCVC